MTGHRTLRRTLAAMRIRIGIVAALLIAASPASTEAASERDRFELWNGCRPIFPYVFVNSGAKRSLGIKQSSFRHIVNTTLRDERLLAKNERTASSGLFVLVEIGDTAFSVDIRYGKPVVDLATGIRDIGSTWGMVLAGAHDDDPNRILTDVESGIDQFVDDYLRVNIRACP